FQGRELVQDLLPFQGGQSPQLHLQDGVGLDLVDVQQLDQALAGVVHRGGAPDQGDDLVQHVQCLDQTAQDVDAVLGLFQQPFGAPHDHFDLVAHPVPDEGVQAQGARYAVDQGEHVRPEVLLQLGVLVQIVQHHLGHRIALEHNDQSLSGAPGSLVPDIGDAGDPPVAHHLGDARGQVVRVDLVGQFADYQAGAALDLRDLHHGTHGDRAAAGAVGLLDAADAQDLRSGGKVRALDPLQQGCEKFLGGGVRVFQEPVHAVGHFAQVVRGDVGGHAHRDPGGPVDQQVG